MIKILALAIAASVILGGCAYASAPSSECWPSVGNWQNAATYSCPTKEGSDKFEAHKSREAK